MWWAMLSRYGLYLNICLVLVQDVNHHGLVLSEVILSKRPKVIDISNQNCNAMKICGFMSKTQGGQYINCPIITNKMMHALSFLSTLALVWEVGRDEREG